MQPLIRVLPDDIREHEPVAYDVYTAEGALLLAKGQLVPGPEHAIILRAEGWRLSAPNETVPAEIPDQDPPAQGATPSVRLPSRGRPLLTLVEVLIADDMQLIRQLLTRMLRDQGIQKIDAVDNGRAAVAHFFRYRPHLVFLDIDMPGMNGVAALKQIKQWSPDTFVCMVSGNSTLVNVREAKTYGVDAFLVKPINQLNLNRVLALYHA